MYREASDFLYTLEYASMRHIQNSVPTWKSFGFHKACKCQNHDCGCPKLQKVSCIDNVYISLKTKASLKVLDDAVTDHYPILVNFNPLNSNLHKKNTYSTIWRRNTAKITPMELESALASVDWSEIYNTEDPNIVLDIIIKNVNVSLDTN